VATGLTTGPFLILPGQALTLQDPRLAVASKAVQIQNNSGVSLSILSGADVWSITSNQSSTIPLPGDGAAIMVTPGGVGTGGLLTCVWLLDDQVSPQPDGPLTGSTVVPETIGTATVAINAVPIGPPTFSQSFTLPANTVAVVAESICIEGTAVGDGIVEFKMVGDTTATTYVDEDFTEGQYLPAKKVIEIASLVSSNDEVSVTISLTITGTIGAYYKSTLNVIAFVLVGGGSSPSSGGVNPPDLNSLLAWTLDPFVDMQSGNNVVQARGVPNYYAILVESKVTVATVLLYVMSGTLGQPGGTGTYVAIYDADGNQLAVSGDVTSEFQGAANTLATCALTSSVTLAPGTYFVGVLFGTGTTGTIASLAAVIASRLFLGNVGVTVPVSGDPHLGWRASTGTGGQATLPAPVTDHPNKSASLAWVGLA